MSDNGIRNIDELREDDGRGMPRGVTVAFVVLGGACIGFAALALGGRSSPPPTAKSDPLGDLVSSRAAGAEPPASARPPVDLSSNDVTFPRILSDQGQPTTALAVVLPAGARAPATPAVGAKPPPATDRLPVVPLPAQAVLEASPIVSRPRDSLTQQASDAAQINSAATSDASAGPGHDGGYQLQVSSFKTQAEGDAFAEQLRARGHKAYVLEARVPGRGTWYRVRIGPFSTQHAATQYRASFEAKEHVVPFVVPPETTARARQP
jgi:cell division septation protein DedD